MGGHQPGRVGCPALAGVGRIAAWGHRRADSGVRPQKDRGRRGEARRQADRKPPGGADLLAGSSALCTAPFHRSASVTCVRLLVYAPTAMQVVTVGQATAFESRRYAPTGVGVGWMRHRVPFHRSARVWWERHTGKGQAIPVPVQADSEVQDTLDRKSPCVPGGLGVDCTVQVVPVSRSASVPAFVPPTAMHAVTDWHQTPLRPPGVCWVGVRWTVHREPSHRSANVPVGLSEESAEAPTPMQAAGAGHATPMKRLLGGLDGVGADTSLQAWPFQRSARTNCLPVPVGFEVPTAMQLDAEAHETAVNPGACAPAGFGVGCTVQCSPFQCSARVPASDPPTATQSVSETQVTQFSNAPGREGIFCSRQVRPFHRCARVSETPRLLLVLPTATQADCAVQATPKRLLAPAPGGLGVGWTFQVEPFHRSASVAGDWFSPGRMENPTARQPVAEVHATPNSWLTAPPGRRGVGWIAQLLPSHRSANVPVGLPKESKETPTPMQAARAGHATPMKRLLGGLDGVGADTSLQAWPFHRSAKVTSVPELFP